jgi:hypothetical protein
VDQAYLPNASAASRLNSSIAQKRIQVNKELIIRKANENKFHPITNREDGLVFSRALKNSWSLLFPTKMYNHNVMVLFRATHPCSLLSHHRM